MVGILARLEQRQRVENPAVPLSSANILETLGLGGSTATGVTVTYDKAMGITAFWAGVRVISQTVASLPLEVFERQGAKGKRVARDHWAHRLLYTRPNPRMTPFVWKELRMVHLLTWGNSYCEKEMLGSGQTIALWPMLPDRTSPRLVNGVTVYDTSVKGVTHTLSQERVLHVPGMGFDGLEGYNPVRVHRESLGLTIAANEYGARFFGNSGRPSGYLKHPGKPGLDERAQYRDEWNQVHGGVGNAGKTAVLWGGMEWHQVSLPPEDAQFLGTKAVQIEEVARILNIHPILLQHFEKVTTWGSGVAQFLTAYGKFTIMPWIERDEDSLNATLFSENERDRYYVKYNANALLRVDPELQAKILEIKRRNAIINADEWRELDEENPLPDGLGRHYYMPLNMLPVEQITNAPADNPPSGQRDFARNPEERSIKARTRTQDTHRRLIENAAERLVKREIEAATKAVEKAFGQRAEPDEALNRWIDEYYPNHQRVIERTMLPVFSSMAELIAAEAADEVGAAWDAEEMAGFARAYTETFAVRETGSSIGQMRGLIQDIAPALLGAALLDRFAEWGQTRPGKIGERESIQLSTGAARFTWQRAGVATFRWRANSGACPLCQQMNGRRIGSKGYFLQPGESVSPAGTAPLVASSNVGGPPLHSGCQCMLMPG